jgi:hypothetical protein
MVLALGAVIVYTEDMESSILSGTTTRDGPGHADVTVSTPLNGNCEEGHLFR